MSGYKTIAAPAEDEFIERKSRFIGYIAPVTTEEEAVAFVESIRQRHREATHNCYAYVLREGQKSRFSDDGEPSGTAGRPILEVVQKEGLTDVAVVVTRYFGGVLLGAGGLVRAYTQGAKCAVDAAKPMMMCPALCLRLEVAYDFYGKLTYLLPKYHVIVKDTQFGEGVTVRLLLLEEKLAAFTCDLEELSAGVVAPFAEGELYADFSGVL